MDGAVAAASCAARSHPPVPSPAQVPPSAPSAAASAAASAHRCSSGRREATAVPFVPPLSPDFPLAARVRAFWNALFQEVVQILIP